MDMVTGGSGFFGTYLVDELARSGHAVRSVDVLPPDVTRDGVSAITADILNRDQLDRAVRGVDRIFHLAAVVPLGRSKRDFWRVNLEGTRNLLDSAIAHGVRKIVYLSSSAVYGIPESNPITEMSSRTPQDQYGKSKLAAEDLCALRYDDSLDITIIRPRTILGPGRLGIFQILFEWTWQDINLPVFGDGSNVCQFVHAKDLARACILAAEKPGSTSYNIGGAPYYSMGESLKGLLNHAGSDATVRKVPEILGASAMRFASALQLAPFSRYHFLMYGKSLYFDTGKAERELGWRPQFGNLDALCDTYDWYRYNREKILSGQTGSLHRKPVKQGLLALGKYLL